MPIESSPIFLPHSSKHFEKAPLDGHGSWLVARLSSDAHHPMQGHVQILRFVLSAPHPPSDHFVLNAPRHPLDRDATFRPHPRALILAPLARAETSSATHLWGAIGTGAHRVGNQKLKTNLYTLSIPCKLFFIFQPTSIFCRNHNSGLCAVCTAPVLIDIYKPLADTLNSRPTPPALRTSPPNLIQEGVPGRGRIPPRANSGAPEFWF